jgi:hypothetical protein
VIRLEQRGVVAFTAMAVAVVVSCSSPMDYLF